MSREEFFRKRLQQRKIEFDKTIRQQRELQRQFAQLEQRKQQLLGAIETLRQLLPKNPSVESTQSSLASTD